MMSGFTRLFDRFLMVLRRRHGTSVAISDAILCLLAGCTALLLRDGLPLPERVAPIAVPMLLIWIAVKVVVFRLYALHRFLWRHASTPETWSILQANTVASAIAAVILFTAFGHRVPLALPVLDLVLSVAYMAGARLIIRWQAELGSHAHHEKKRRSHAFIYGAGNSGIALLRETRQNPSLGIVVSGFVDDDPRKHGTYVHGIQVLGPGTQLKTLAVHYPADQVLVAINTISASEMTAVLDNCMSAGLACRILPGIAEAVEGRTLANQIRNISIEDLLGRHSVMLDHESIAETLAGKTVMVTGAAGSIGSELCRQIARHTPRLIVGYDAAETPLFFLDREMKGGAQPVPFQPVIGSIQNRQRLAEVMQEYRPAVVYHAAAYKHVPMMEMNPYEAVANNVFGTESVLQMAMENGITSFIMISTDKAVNPTNVMGTTKRIAELLVNAFSSNVMRCVSVRFGNVLGSNGSVIPIFQQQIAAGGPLTVTHPEMRRYFMTIPEAAQLVLQAAAIGKTGEILVLDMGEPVKIVDLATNMIRLAGLQPGADIEVQFTGIRPGEKLYEEISLGDESMIPTPHRSIKVFQGPAWDRAGMQQQLASIRCAWERRDTTELLRLLKEAVPEYSVGHTYIKPEPAADTKDDLVFSVTLLGAINRKLNANLLESSDRFLKLALEESVPMDSAIRVEWRNGIDLAEIRSCTSEDSRYVAVAKIAHRLQST